MTTLKKFEDGLKEIPAATSWDLADLGKARGKQELFAKQTPQRLKALRQHALIESAISSNRIEGVTVDQDRVQAVLFGKRPLHDRDEEKERSVHPLIALAAFNLDFLCIHPFRDGNGRVSRLLLLLQLYHLGYEAGRYVSLERLIEQNKDRYYETLEQSSQGWHEGKHDPWPYINFVLFILKIAYKEFRVIPL